jgi:hypothetical protein
MPLQQPLLLMLLQQQWLPQQRPLTPATTPLDLNQLLALPVLSMGLDPLQVLLVHTLLLKVLPLNLQVLRVLLVLMLLPKVLPLNLRVLQQQQRPQLLLTLKLQQLMLHQPLQWLQQLMLHQPLQWLLLVQPQQQQQLLPQLLHQVLPLGLLDQVE